MSHSMLARRGRLVWGVLWRAIHSRIVTYFDADTGASGMNIQRRTRFAVLLIASLCAPSAVAQSINGYYSGTGATNSITGLGFQPDWLLIKRILSGGKGGSGGFAQYAETTIATNSMTSGTAKKNAGGLGHGAVQTGLVDSLDSGGFTVAGVPDVNETGGNYLFWAIKEDSNYAATGSYTGDGNASQAITGVGFQPNVLLAIGHDTGSPVIFHSDANGFAPNIGTVGTCLDMSKSHSSVPNCVDSLDTDGFTVDGTDSPGPNVSGEIWHYLALKNNSGDFNSGSYQGDGSASRDITVSGLDPTVIYVVNDAAGSDSLGTGAVMSHSFLDDPGLSNSWQQNIENNAIIAHGTNKFTVGYSDFTNTNSPSAGDYYWFALPDNPPTAVKLEWMQATRFSRGTLIQWRSGFESNNLGYRIFAVDGSGHRKLLSPSVIAGSSLFVGPTTRMTAGRSYSWWDKGGGRNPPYAYALEAIDLDWKRRIVRQVSPRLAGDDDVPPPMDTPQLDRVGSRRTGRVLPPHLLKGRNRLTATELRGLSRRWYSVADTAEPAPDDALPSQFATLFPERQGVFADAESLDLCKGAPASALHRKQWELAAKRSIKIGVDQTGWVFVSQPNLYNAGLSADVDPTKLQLFVDGREVPILVRGEADGKFDSGDGIEFYGIALDTQSTDTRVYWLVAGDQTGKRLPSINVESASSGFSQSNTYTVETKPRTVYIAALNNGAASNFFGPLVGNLPVALSLEAPSVDPGSGRNALLEIGLQGLTRIYNHAVKVVLNGVMVGTVAFKRQSQVVGRISVPHDLLQSGENVVQLVSNGDPSDKSFVDFIRLTYQRLYSATGGATGGEYRFVASGGESVKITGLGGAAARLVEITDPWDPQLVPLPKEAQPADGIALTLPGGGTGTFLLVSQAGLTSAKFVKANIPTKWNAQSNAAQLLIIADDEIYPNAVDLQEHRRNQGWDVSALDVEDIYDEFTFGHKDPWAIRCLNHWAQRVWAETPNYLLLFGDASFDRRDFLGLGQRDRVPTKLAHGRFLETASDDWFADTDGDGIADMAVGRLPAQDSGEAAGIVKKLIAYDAAEVDPSWSKRAAFVSDLEFANNSDAVRADLPKDWTSKQILYDESNVQSRSKDLIAELNRGQAIVNYFGHGSVSVWSGGELFSTNDALGLKNESRLPVVFALTCLNGFFHDVYTHSLAEGLIVAENGGAIAVFASADMDFASQQRMLSHKLIDVITNEKVETLGAAALKVKASIGGPQRQSWIFFGDPTTTLKGWTTSGPSNPNDPDGPGTQPGCGCSVSTAWDTVPALGFLIVILGWRRFRYTRRS